MRTILPVIVVALLAASAAPAQQFRDSGPDKSAKSLPLRPPKATANPCAEYGAGFVRIEGSSTCVKIGGSLSVGVGGARRAEQSEGRLQLDILVPVLMSCALLWWVSRGMPWTTRLSVAAVTLVLIFCVLLFE